MSIKQYVHRKSIIHTINCCLMVLKCTFQDLIFMKNRFSQLAFGFQHPTRVVRPIAHVVIPQVEVQYMKIFKSVSVIITVNTTDYHSEPLKKLAVQNDFEVTNASISTAHPSRFSEFQSVCFHHCESLHGLLNRAINGSVHRPAATKKQIRFRIHFTYINIKCCMEMPMIGIDKSQLIATPISLKQ